MELSDLYREMQRARSYEVAVADLWERGFISGEMHLGTGEEAVAAGVVSHLRDGDGLALTHRGSPALVVRGVPLQAMLSEMLGLEEGLGEGKGGHMHLFSRDHLAATSGIVGASLPTGAGFALAAKRLRPRCISVALTGDGAMNQGMALETLNLAASWNLPLLVVCVDNGWAITTATGAVSAGELSARAAACGWTTAMVDGSDVEAIYLTAGRLVEQLRAGKPPAFLYAKCPRLDGHFLGDPLLRTAKDPLGAGRETLGKVMEAAVATGGGGLLQRIGSMAKMMGTMVKARTGSERGTRRDPIVCTQRLMTKRGLARDEIDREVAEEIHAALTAVLAARRAARGDGAKPPVPEPDGTAAAEDADHD